MQQELLDVETWRDATTNNDQRKRVRRREEEEEGIISQPVKRLGVGIPEEVNVLKVLIERKTALILREHQLTEAKNNPSANEQTQQFIQELSSTTRTMRQDIEEAIQRFDTRAPNTVAEATNLLQKQAETESSLSAKMTNALANMDIPVVTNAPTFTTRNLQDITEITKQQKAKMDELRTQMEKETRDRIHALEAQFITRLNTAIEDKEVVEQAKRDMEDQLMANLNELKEQLQTKHTEQEHNKMAYQQEIDKLEQDKTKKKVELEDTMKRLHDSERRVEEMTLQTEVQKDMIEKLTQKHAQHATQLEHDLMKQKDDELERIRAEWQANQNRKLEELATQYNDDKRKLQQEKQDMEQRNKEAFDQQVQIITEQYNERIQWVQDDLQQKIRELTEMKTEQQQKLMTLEEEKKLWEQQVLDKSTQHEAIILKQAEMQVMMEGNQKKIDEYINNQAEHQAQLAKQYVDLAGSMRINEQFVMQLERRQEEFTVLIDSGFSDVLEKIKHQEETQKQFILGQLAARGLSDKLATEQLLDVDQYLNEEVVSRLPEIAGETKADYIARHTLLQYYLTPVLYRRQMQRDTQIRDEIANTRQEISDLKSIIQTQVMTELKKRLEADTRVLEQTQAMMQRFAQTIDKWDGNIKNLNIAAEQFVTKLENVDVSHWKEEALKKMNTDIEVILNRCIHTYTTSLAAVLQTQEEGQTKKLQGFTQAMEQVIQQVEEKTQQMLTRTDTLLSQTTEQTQHILAETATKLSETRRFFDQIQECQGARLQLEQQTVSMYNQLHETIEKILSEKIDVYTSTLVSNIEKMINHAIQTNSVSMEQMVGMYTQIQNTLENVIKSNEGLSPQLVAYMQTMQQSIQSWHSLETRLEQSIQTTSDMSAVIPELRGAVEAIKTQPITVVYTPTPHPVVVGNAIGGTTGGQGGGRGPPPPPQENIPLPTEEEEEEEGEEEDNEGLLVELDVESDVEMATEEETSPQQKDSDNKNNKKLQRHRLQLPTVRQTVFSDIRETMVEKGAYLPVNQIRKSFGIYNRALDLAERTPFIVKFNFTRS